MNLYHGSNSVIEYPDLKESLPMKKTDYLVLLRGINVGGKNTIKMDDLKKAFEKMKFSDIKTYIQSGNVLFKDYENNKLKIAKRIEKKLFEMTQNEIMIKILTFSDLHEIISDIPDGFGDEPEKYKYDVLFLIEPLTTKEIMTKIKIMKGNDKIYEGKKAFYVKRIAEKLTGSYITEITKTWQNVTVRNLNTTRKLHELMLERQR
ncbi:MAG: DUF1697 domain-containing protein [Fibromonadales bacterium]|nr:DUF1697 domain-containing protein [Fibromonadales bacterium]